MRGGGGGRRGGWMFWGGRREMGGFLLEVMRCVAGGRLYCVEAQVKMWAFHSSAWDV